MKTYIAKDSSFLTTDTRRKRWAVPYSFDCLNARIDVLLDRNRDALRGKRVLDLGSHIGTFSYAARQLGARLVHGVDTEPRTVERCLELFRANGMPPTSYKFEVADAAAFLESLGEDSFDTVFSFGLLYYTTEPYRLLRLMCRVASKTVLLDTFTAAYAVIQGKDALKVYPRISPKTLELPLMLFARTQPEKKDYRLPETFQHRGREISLTSLPTPALLELWFQSLGMKFQKLDWSDYILGPRTYHDLVTTDQKRKSHWADIYSSEVRVAYRLSPKMR